MKKYLPGFLFMLVAGTLAGATNENFVWWTGAAFGAGAGTFFYLMLVMVDYRTDFKKKRKSISELHLMSIFDRTKEFD